MPTQRYHHQDSVVGDLINPVQGIRDEQRRKGIQPKDHMAENRRIIRNISHQKQREALKKEEEANAEKFKLAEYQNVGSRVMQKVNEAKAEEPKDFLKAHSGAAGAPHMYPRETTTAGSYVPRQSALPSVPKQEDLAREYEERKQARITKEVNIIKSNMNAIKRQTEAMRAAEAARAAGAEQTHKRGEVPAYLKRFQKQHAAEEAQKQREQEEARERARVPHGTRLVGPEEKEQLLSELRKSLQLEIKRLNSFSVANDSMQLIKAREECERKIDQIEKTIREFERPGDLFLALD
ncbi:Calmodulin-binding protein [Giardia duodenalis]|uniref:Calmodulin-binding protein n=1 Tax=Giardia intestinalis TaxID=5741 RepID=V6TRX0_GIAIN|nr:Calmodulin-binding protein [Giardia intestinalis]